MDTSYTEARAPVVNQVNEASKSAVSWAAIFAGTAVAISISVVLVVLGSGLGLASLTPSARSVASPGSLAALATVWIVIVQWLSAACGGYVTGRLRTRWVGTHTHEIFFRDTAHGLVTWAVATAIVAMVVGSAASGGIRAATTMGSAAAQGAAGNAQVGSVAPYEVDTLFRTTSSRDAESPARDGRGEATRILTKGLSAGDVPDTDRSYLAALIAAQTGISQADAQKRVDDTFARVRQEAEAARKAAATTSLLTALAMMIGAFVACVAAALGGRERDRHP